MTRVTDIKIPQNTLLGLHSTYGDPINSIVEGKKKGFTVIAPRLGVLGCKAKVRRGLRMTN